MEERERNEIKRETERDIERQIETERERQRHTHTHREREPTDQNRLPEASEFQNQPESHCEQ